MLFSVLATFVVIGIYYAYKKVDYSTWKVTVAIVRNVWEFDGTDITYEYEVNGIVYKDGGASPVGTTYGDKFLVLYNPQDPSESLFNTDTPFFYDSDDVDYTDGEISGVGKVTLSSYKDKKYYCFGYVYYVNGKKYSREQDFTFCNQLNFELKKGMKFRVKYDIHVPERAVMLIGNNNMYIIKDLPCDQQKDIRF